MKKLFGDDAKDAAFYMEASLVWAMCSCVRVRGFLEAVRAPLEAPL